MVASVPSALLLTLLAAALTGGQPDARCTPPTVAACRPTTVTCAVADAAAAEARGWRFSWDFGDGGGAHDGARLRRVLPAGIVGYAVRFEARRGDEVRRARLVLPLDRTTLGACAGGAAPTAPPPPVPAPPPGALRIATISDSNGPYGAVAQAEDVDAAVRALTGRVRPAVVVHVGDMVAGQKRGLPADRVRAMWEGYLAAVAAPLAAAGVPLLPVPGNHDAAAGRRLVDREVYAAVWRDRRPEAPGLTWVDTDGWPFRWAARVAHPGEGGGASALLVALDAPTGRVTAADVAWLRRVLAAPAPDDDTPDDDTPDDDTPDDDTPDDDTPDDDGPRLVFAHVPPWQPTDRAYGTLQRWDALAPVLRDGGAAALVTGHYEVFFPTVLDGVEVILDGTLARACAPRRDLPATPPRAAAPGHTGGCRCRPLAGTDVCQGSSFVVLDVQGSAVVRKFAVHGPAFDHVFEAALLPEAVGPHARAPGWL